MGDAEPATRVASAGIISVSVLLADAEHTSKKDHQEPADTSALKKPLRRKRMIVPISQSASTSLVVLNHPNQSINNVSTYCSITQKSIHMK